MTASAFGSMNLSSTEWDYVKVPKVPDTPRCALPAVDDRGMPRKREKDSSVKDEAGEKVYTLAEFRSKLRNVHAVGRPIGKGGGRRKLSETRTTMVQTLSFNTAANTAYALSTNVSPANANDWTAYTTLYDEVKVHGFRVHCTYTYGPASTDAYGRTIVALCYDPSDATAATSVVNTLSASQHAGPWLITSPFTSAATFSAFMSGPIEVSFLKGGFHTHKFVIPRGNARSSANSSTFGDEWASTADTLDYWGFLKTYIEPGGTAGVINARYFISYDVSFRSRV